MTEREDGPGALLESQLRAWGEWARETEPLPRPLPITTMASQSRRLWPGLVAAALLVAVVSVTEAAPRLSHRSHPTPPARQQQESPIKTRLSDGLGYYNLIDGTFHLRRSATEGGPSDYAYKFGPVAASIQPIAGDWNGDGKDGIGYWVPEPAATPNNDGSALMYLRDDATRFGAFQYSFPIPHLGISRPSLFAGDWTGTGHDGLADAEIDCVCAQSTETAELYLDRDAVNGFQAAYQLSLHPPGDISPPFAGDWTGSGKDGIGYYNYADQTVHLRNDATSDATSDYAYRFAVGDRPVGPNIVLLAGNW